MQARAKEKPYDFRRDAPRGIQVSYPVPEPVITPRAREGLRTVVPTIFPPSAVNRGESVPVQSLEPERRPRPTAPAALAVQQSGRSPKKRGRKPKLHLHYDQDDGGVSEPYNKRGRPPEESHGVSKIPPRLHHHHHHHHHHHGETSDHSLIQLTKRFEEKTTITPKPCGEQRQQGAAGSSYRCAFLPERRASDQGAHRTSYATSRKPKHREEHRRHQREEEHSPEPDVSTGSIYDASAGPSPSWTPCFGHMDTVTVTDVTMNLLTVTVRESSTDKGFFRGKR